MASSEPWPHTLKVRFYRRTFKGYFGIFLSHFAFDAVKTQAEGPSEVVLELANMGKDLDRRITLQAHGGLKCRNVGAQERICAQFVGHQ